MKTKPKAMENRTRIQDVKLSSELSRSPSDEPAMRMPCSERKVAKLAMCRQDAKRGRRIQSASSMNTAPRLRACLTQRAWADTWGINF